MSNKSIDYSNTIFYKIYCKDTDVKDIYIGHTTNFVQRKIAHKQSCTHAKYCNHNCKVYSVIRQFGGWDNWNMDIIAFHHCDDKPNALKMEQQYFEEYNATLNSIEPCPKPKPKIIIKNFPKAKVIVKEKKFSNKPRLKHFCDKCNFTCSNKKDFSKHLLTKKHNRVLEKTPDSDIPKEMEATHECVCGKKYMHITGLYKHKKKCTFKEENFQEVPEVFSQEVPENTNREIIDKLVNSNTEMVTSITEMREMVMMLMKMQKQTQENTENFVNKLLEVLHQRGYTKNTDFT